MGRIQLWRNVIPRAARAWRAVKASRGTTTRAADCSAYRGPSTALNVSHSETVSSAQEDRERKLHPRPTITMIPLLGLLLLIPSVLAQPTAFSTPPTSALQRLSADFWEWRASEQPFSFDDIPRLDRRTGWAADW